MAKRARGGNKEAAPRKGRAKKSKDTGFEVEEAGGGAEHGLETGLALLTLVSLLIGLVLMQLRMAEHGAGMFG